MGWFFELLYAYRPNDLYDGCLPPIFLFLHLDSNWGKYPCWCSFSFSVHQALPACPHLCQTSSSMKSQLTGLRHTLTSLNMPHSTSGMGWHSALERPTHQVSDPTLILLESAHPSSTLLTITSQPQTTGAWSVSHHLVTEPSCPRQLNPISQVFVPCTSMLAYLLNAASPHSSVPCQGYQILLQGKSSYSQAAHHACYSQEAHFCVWQSQPQR